MICPSAVLLISGCDRADVRRLMLGLLPCEGLNGEGSDDADVLAGACRRPRGSLWSASLFDINKTDPGTSSVSLSFKIPKLHFGGVYFCPDSTSELAAPSSLFRASVALFCHHFHDDDPVTEVGCVS